MSSFPGMISSLLKGIFSPGSPAVPIEPGAALPEVSQRNQEGDPVRFPQAHPEGWLLVYFFPRADTPGCTKQACSLRDSYAELAGMGVAIYGVSTDPGRAQKAFREKYDLPFDLLADEDGSVAAAFGVPKMLGFTKRQAFLFKDGVLVWRDLSASTDQQAADVLRVIGGR